MSAFTNKTAAITGRNSGIDLATARPARAEGEVRDRLSARVSFLTAFGGESKEVQLCQRRQG